MFDSYTTHIHKAKLSKISLKETKKRGIVCPNCEGTGTIVWWHYRDRNEDPCETCGGKGYYKLGENYEKIKS